LNSDPTKRVKKSVNKKKNNGNNGGTKAKWIQKIFILAFAFSVFFSFISENLLQRVNIYVSILILLIIITIGVIFDIIGIAVASANESPFHSMAADKVPGGKEAVKLIRNADIVSNICNDVVGDICGIISGAASATIVLKTISIFNNVKVTVLSAVIAGIVSTLTIGGKAIGKGIAIKNSKTVVYNVALVLHILKKRLRINLFKDNKKH